MNAKNKNDDWLVGKLRLTVFLHAATQLPTVQSWWAGLTGTEPETQTAKPKSGTHQSTGLIQYKDKKFTLELTTKPDRVDWILKPLSIGDEEAVPTLGHYCELSPYFNDLMGRWLGDAQVSIRRMAYGVVLLLHVDNKVSGYKEISKYLPTVQIDPVGSSDFQYTINRRRGSDIVTGMEINRLSKWDVPEFTKVLVERNSAGAEIIHHGITCSSISCSLELDISTHSTRKEEIPVDKQVDVFNELVDLGNEIAEKGDIP